MIGRPRRGDGETPPFIIRKLRRRRHPGPHGSWKVAYSDFMTSLLALFIVLWAAEQSPQVRSSIASYFRNPSVVPGATEASVLPASTGVVPLQSVSGVGSDADDSALAEAAARIRAALEEDPALRPLRDQVRIEMTPEGLRIQMAERDDSLLFEIGSATVKPALTRLLSAVAQVIAALPNDVAVEGHTDSRQYTRQGRGYSNWELSAERANSARRVLESGGLRARQIARVVGFADHELIMGEDPLNPQNRRVSVIVRHAPGSSAQAPAGLKRLSVRADEASR
jgi:chemotaxis protein MotB